MSPPSISGSSEAYARVHDEFLRLEEDLDLFDWQIAGFPVWERIRTSVCNDVIQGSGIFSQAHPSMEKDLRDTLRGGYLWARNVFRDNPLLGGRHDILVWGHKRRKRLEDGLWWDVIFDPLFRDTGRDVLWIEDDYNLSHRQPTRSEAVRYLDFVTFSSTIYRKIARWRSVPDEDRVRELERALEDRFGVTVDIATLVDESVTDRRVYLPLYRRVLRRVDPEVVFVAVSYGKESFVEACRLEGVPVVEFQHGTIGEYHLGYSFPGNRTKRDFPDYLFTFGPFWSRDVPLPIDEDRVFDVGYEFLDMKHRQVETEQQTNEVVFVSQGTVAHGLSKLAVDLSERTDAYDVVYKLHPGEAERWRTEYPWLVESDVCVVDDDPSLYELFGRARTQVGVYSTAIYEGLRFGLSTVLVDLPAVQQMDRLVEQYEIPVVGRIEELERAVDAGERQSVEYREFFTPDPTGQFGECLDAVLSNEFG